ncbi:MAG TPA: hypothetical protein VJ372_20835 [Pyrinomonadaceae bacterium]|nr:hypothetical protein [Pyrinomonadaceae bacterium]
MSNVRHFHTLEDGQRRGIKGARIRGGFDEPWANDFRTKIIGAIFGKVNDNEPLDEKTN